MNDAPALLVVCDAGPLIHLDELNCPDLLADFSRVVVPDVVWREVELHRPTALDQKTIRLERLQPHEKPSARINFVTSLAGFACRRGSGAAISAGVRRRLLVDR